MVETHPTHRQLIRCQECGMWAGIINRNDLKDNSVRPDQDPIVEISCRCDGPLCERCGVNRIMRPISDYYDEAGDSIWHVPYFGGMAPCGECKRREKNG